MSRTKTCEKCGADLDWEDPDPDTGIQGGWYCLNYEVAFPYEYSDFEDEYHDEGWDYDK